MFQSSGWDAEGNANRCNRVHDVRDHCGVFCMAKPEWDHTVEPNTAIEGYHSNCTGAVGDAKGTGQYRIKLSDGWKLQSLKWDGKKPRPSAAFTFPARGTRFEMEFGTALAEVSRAHS